MEPFLYLPKQAQEEAKQNIAENEKKLAERKAAEDEKREKNHAKREVAEQALKEKEAKKIDAKFETDTENLK